MEKIYNKTQWENTPSTNTPINETNLNNIENGVDALDDRVVELSNTKSNVDWVQLQKSGDKIAEITIDGVKKTVYAKRGSGGGGGGTTDYEDLDNKPKINNVELNGNKTLSDLGINAESVGALPNTTVIPTTLAELAEDTTHRTVTDAEKTKWNEGGGGGSTVSWNQIVTSGTKIAEVSVDGNKTDVYAPTGGSGGSSSASDITYDNSTSGMTATNVQDAIDEQKQDLTHFVGGDEWTPRTWNQGEACIHNNKAWLCIAPNTVEPSESATTYWTQISLKSLCNVSVISSQTVSATVDGETRNIVLQKLSNGQKSIQIGFSNTTTSAKTISNVIPSDYAPISDIACIGTTYSDNYIRRFTLYANGSIKIWTCVSGDKGAYLSANYF